MGDVLCEAVDSQELSAFVCSRRLGRAAQPPWMESLSRGRKTSLATSTYLLTRQLHILHRAHPRQFRWPPVAPCRRLPEPIALESPPRESRDSSASTASFQRRVVLHAYSDQSARPSSPEVVGIHAVRILFLIHIEPSADSKTAQDPHRNALSLRSESGVPRASRRTESFNFAAQLVAFSNGISTIGLFLDLLCVARYRADVWYAEGMQMSTASSALISARIRPVGDIAAENREGLLRSTLTTLESFGSRLGRPETD
jgi:hypothetical protein